MAALAILGIPLMWLFRTPLCILAGTAIAHPDGVACSSQVTRTAQVSQAGMAALAVIALGAGLAVLVGWRMGHAASAYRAEARRVNLGLAALVIVALATLGGVLAALLFLDSSSPTPVTLSSDVLALMGLAVMAIPAWLVLRARDARRYVVAVLALAVLWLLLWYPNISGLPLPADFASLYQGLLPTWNWDFQFTVNTDPASHAGVIDLSTLVIGGITVVFVVGVAIVACLWDRPRRSESGS